MITFTALLIFIVGINIGSFLNAIIWRLHTKEGFLRGRSYCPKCKTSIRARDLVPLLSYALLRGRCRDCQKHIDWQYPLVELITGVLFVITYLKFSLSEEFIVYAIYVSFLIVVFVFDLRHYLILDRVMLPAGIVALFGSLILGVGFFNILIGIIIGGGFFFLQYVLSRGKWIGGGDIRLGLVMGLMLGWEKLLAALFVSYLIGSVAGISLVLWKQKKWQSRLPFGVFLTTATFVTLVWGEVLINWYLDLVG
ncbi:prepilin peptidase [Patescibacteria group bacterium]|nr:prepilin peptidase [Patescibacteria group bacterium]MBU1890312.1 prepilin peptidase [Patescibacteria group bacterium]